MNNGSRKYRHIFFDLDMTLWDFESNAREAYEDIYRTFRLSDRGISSLNDFVSKYFIHNDRLWEQYRNGEIEKELLRTKRFELTLLDYGIDDPALAQAIGHEYVIISPTKTRLFPNAHATLSYLQKQYTLSIITNGFEEVQFHKLKNSHLDGYFSHVITSEQAGCKKPDPDIFRYALQQAGAEASQSLMIGDDMEVDVLGAMQAGMDAIYFNPKKIGHNGNIYHEISDLNDLIAIL
jgi:putative hydrolase of the HAD superfamily